MKQPLISCHTHDYVEIACVYHLRVELLMIDGNCVIGNAQTIELDLQKNECLVLDSAQDAQRVPLNRAKSMRALEKNPHFDLVEF